MRGDDPRDRNPPVVGAGNGVAVDVAAGALFLEHRVGERCVVGNFMDRKDLAIMIYDREEKIRAFLPPLPPARFAISSVVHQEVDAKHSRRPDAVAAIRCDTFS